MDTPIHELYLCIQARYIKVVWTHKIQEKQAELHLKRSCICQRHKNWFTVLTTGCTISPIFPFLDFSNGEHSLLMSITAIFAAALSYFTLRYPDGALETKALENKKYAARVHDLKNKYESLLYEIKANHLTIDQIIARRNELEKVENELYSEPAPHTSQKAVKEAKPALEDSKDSTTEIQEIRQIVPPELQEFPQSTE